MTKTLLAGGVLLGLSACTQHIHRPDTAAPAPIHAAYSVKRDIGFTPPSWPAPLRLDVYRPVGPGPFPSVLLIHGGAWKRGDRAQVEGMAERIAERGYLVVNTTYRLVPEHVWPAQLHDVQQALRWMRSAPGQAEGIDPTRVATFGYSAGGHLAALLGSIGDDPAWNDGLLPVQAVVAGGNPADLPAFKDGDLVPAFIGAPYDANAQAYRDASPITHVSRGDPPVFVYHAGLDTLVPLDQAERYHAALEAVGVNHEYLVLRGREHLGGFFFDGAAMRAALEFLDRHLR